jgi:hypothetical protein
MKNLIKNQYKREEESYKRAIKESFIKKKKTRATYQNRENFVSDL